MFDLPYVFTSRTASAFYDILSFYDRLGDVSWNFIFVFFFPHCRPDLEAA